MSTITKAAIEEQIAIEQESVAMGKERYLRDLEYRRDHDREYETRPVAQVMRHVLSTLCEVIENERTDFNKPGPGRRKNSVGLTMDLEAEALAFHTLRNAMASMTDSQTFTMIAVKIGNDLDEERFFRRYRKENEASYDKAQNELQTRRGLSGRDGRRKVTEMAAAKGVHLDRDLSAAAVSGAWLLDCLLSAAPTLFHTFMTKGGRNMTVRMFSPTVELQQYVARGHDAASLFSPDFLPMVIPPRSWSSSLNGGYINEYGKVKLVKTLNRQYLEALDQVEMPKVYDAINTIQNVAWEVNPAVLAVALAVWESGYSVGDIPAADPEPMPNTPNGMDPKVLKVEDFEAFKHWAIQARHVSDRNRAMVSKRLSAGHKVRIANRFKGRPIWFPHCLDFRGRIYPLPNHLNPQGDDLSKALLQFHEAKPMDERAFWWLKVHIANCFGVDKVSFEDRVKWAEDRMDLLLDSGEKPLTGERLWMSAEDKFLALAACCELNAYFDHGAGYMSKLPIPMDGTCNGLQNFSALLRDEVGGAATNLTPSDKPSDIYNEVAKVVSAHVTSDAEAGELFAIIFDGKINRKMVKQPVMTLPYGATKSGMREQLENAVRSLYPGLVNEKTMWKATEYLAGVVYNAIGKVVVAAMSAMDWLRQVAKLAASESFPIRWTTPAGFVVLQDYREPNAKQIRVHIEGVRQSMFVNMKGTKLDKRRQRTGISPNLIHSLDASHLMLTVNMAREAGVTSFSFIHDSYGTHAADIDKLHECIRGAFIEQYEGNYLEDFLKEIREQLPEELANELPPVPPCGNLDLSLIKASKYFFA